MRLELLDLRVQRGPQVLRDLPVPQVPRVPLVQQDLQEWRARKDLLEPQVASPSTASALSSIDTGLRSDALPGLKMATTPSCSVCFVSWSVSSRREND